MNFARIYICYVAGDIKPEHRLRYAFLHFSTHLLLDAYHIASCDHAAGSMTYLGYGHEAEAG
jgi:hypothetical protein